MLSYAYESFFTHLLPDVPPSAERGGPRKAQTWEPVAVKSYVTVVPPDTNVALKFFALIELVKFTPKFRFVFK